MTRSRGRVGPLATGGATAPGLDVDALLDDPATGIIVCCGSGGVGKTTTSAALALRAAERGRTVVVLTIVWVLPFVIYGIAMSLVHVFRTADIHETVPSLVAMTVVWEMLFVDVFTGAYEGVPGPLRLIMLMGAPVSVTAVGLWELHRLRVYYGLRLRGALLR